MGFLVPIICSWCRNFLWEYEVYKLSAPYADACWCQKFLQEHESSQLFNQDSWVGLRHFVGFHFWCYQFGIETELLKKGVIGYWDWDYNQIEIGTHFSPITCT